MMGWWQSIQSRLFGNPVGDGGVGLETTIEPSFPWPMWMLWLLLAIAAVVIVLVYSRERDSASRWQKGLLAALRLSLVGVLALMLMGWTYQRHRTDLPDVVIVIDDTQSMGLVDHYPDEKVRRSIEQRLADAGLSEATRLNLAKTLLLEKNANLLKELAGRSNVKVYLAGATARAQSGEPDSLPEQIKTLEPTQPVSRLGRSVREAIEAQRGRPTAAVIVLTDGVTTEGKPLTDAAEYARRKSVPLYIVGLGNDRPPIDLQLSDLLADDTAFVNDLIQFEFKLASHGLKGNAVVRLRQVDQPSPLAEQTVTLNPDGSAQTIRLSHRPEQEGEFEYIIEVEPKEGESSTENNRLTKRIRVADETVRVLLVQAYPNYEFRFLKTLLERELNKDANVEKAARGFRTVLQEADLEYVETDKSAERVFPVSRDELFKYDVVIFGDVNPALLSQSVMNNLYEFVTVRGGGLIFIGGPRFTPLAYRDTPLEPLLPMDLTTVTTPDPDVTITDSFQPRLTPLGLASPATQLAENPSDNARLWQSQLPPLRWFLRMPDLRPGVRVLAEHPTEKSADGQPLPIITLQFQGAGKVVFHATDETHRWRFRLGDRYFGRYWIQTIRYLCRSKLLGGSRTVELTTDRREYMRGEPVRIRARFLDDRQAPAQDNGVTVVVEHASGERKSVALSRSSLSRGVFEGSVSGLLDGQYRVWLATPTTEGQPPATQFLIAAPPGELARLQMDSREIDQAAKISSGKSYRFATAANLVRDLPRGRQVRIESLPPEPIWNTPSLAAIFVGLLATEWLLRKRWGLI
jgi:hypothetical protein